MLFLYFLLFFPSSSASFSYFLLFFRVLCVFLCFSFHHQYVSAINRTSPCRHFGFGVPPHHMGRSGVGYLHFFFFACTFRFSAFAFLLLFFFLCGFYPFRCFSLVMVFLLVFAFFPPAAFRLFLAVFPSCLSLFACFLFAYLRICVFADTATG